MRLRHCIEEGAVLFACLLLAGIITYPNHLSLTGISTTLLLYGFWHGWQLGKHYRLLQQDLANLPTNLGFWRVINASLARMQKSHHEQQQTLKKEVNSLEAIISVLPELIFTIDRENRLVRLNPAGGEVLLKKKGQAASKVLNQLLTTPILQAYLQKGDFSQPIDCHSPTRPESIFSLTVLPLPNNQGERVIVLQDVTANRHLEAHKRDFVANASHELRTPLTVVHGFAEQLARGDYSTRKIKEISKLVLQQTVRMQEMIQGFLTLSRLEMQSDKGERSFVDVPRILTTIGKDARRLSGKRSHNIKLNISSSKGLSGNQQDLYTAFSNLVNNAVRHTPDKTSITISWSVNASGGHLTVADRGNGIAAEHLPRLTERLYRVDSSRSRDTGGSGLGLAIVSHILDKHGAKLDITSLIRQGTSFRCDFPPSLIRQRD